jgi:hypothetical protein
MKKRLLYKVLIGLACFVIGLSSASIWNAHRAISLCELDANPETYAGKTIRIRAILERIKGDYILARSSCGSDTVALADIELDANKLTNFSLPQSLIISNGKPEQIYLMDAIVVGRFKPPFRLGCVATQNRISNAKVERVFSVQKFEDMPQAVKWIKTNSY